MKTKIIRPLVCCLLFLLITNFSFSQPTINKKDLNKTVDISISHNRKRHNSANAPVSINKKIEKSFTGYFAGSTGQNWSMAGNNFHNSFYTNGNAACALFDKHGHLIYAISYGQEKDMPSNVRKIVKSTYYDYVITLAIEVKQNDRDIWIVNMKSNSTHKTVRIEDGEMELVQEFKESSVRHLISE